LIRLDSNYLLDQVESIEQKTSNHWTNMVTVVMETKEGGVFKYFAILKLLFSSKLPETSLIDLLQDLMVLFI
jgi:hypothetical protein